MMLKALSNQLKKLNVKKYFCPVCKLKIHRFLPLPDYYNENLKKNSFLYSLDDLETLNFEAYSCPYCAASDRDRLYALYISRYLKEFNNTKISMLVIAPTHSLTEYLKNTGKTDFRTADLMMQGVDDQIDITNMACYTDESFDSFICSHVLEHVTDDLKAMSELYRILKPKGWGILMVPIMLTLIHIDEDPFLEDVGERWRRFGQDDHIRMYSKNGFIERVKATGFTIREYSKEYFSENSLKKYGILEKSILYIVEKQN